MTQAPVSPLTILVTRVVGAADRAPFEQALHELTEASVTFAGHLGVSVFRPATPTDPVYRILFRFDSEANHERWRGDPAIAARIAAVDALTQGEPQLDTLNGLEAWFTAPPAAVVRPPPRIKMALATWVGLYPLVSLLLWVLRPVVAQLPFLLSTLLITGLATVAMTWAVMPRLTRWLRPWLYAGR